MFCRFCGKEIPEGGKFCVNCGRSIENTETPNQSESGQQVINPMPESAYRPVSPATEYPMKWFKFLIYFQLFANAVLYLFSAISSIFGLQYDGDAELIYYIAPGLRVVDVIYGIVCLGLMAGAIVVRQKLAHYRKNAPVLYIGFVTAGSVIGLVYTFATMAVTGAISPYALGESLALISAAVLGTLIGVGIFIPLNYIYFKKRKELFIN